MLERSSTRYLALLALVDILVTLLSLKLAEVARLTVPFGAPPVRAGIDITAPLYVIVLGIWGFFFLTFNAYDARRIARLSTEIQIITAAVLTSTTVFAGVLFLTYRGLSRLLLIYFFVFDLGGLFIARLSMRGLARLFTGTQGTRNVLIVGTNPMAREVAQAVERHSWMGPRVIGFVSIESDSSAIDGTPDDPPILGTLAEAASIVETHGISEVIIALPLRATPDLPKVMQQLQGLPVNIKVVPDFFDLVFFHVSLEELAGIPLIGLKEPVISGFPALIKRTLDVVVAATVLLLLTPFLGIVAILIRLDSPGPVLFKQQRVGQYGRLFWMYKFRTMVADAEKRQHELISRDADGNIIFKKTPNDPRITRVGHVLRRYSIDELPQLVNVLRGEMSLVGPRPELPSIVQSYQPWQHKRFLVPPGMTGWWQIRGRSQQPMHLRTEDDLYYIQNYSLLLDLQILWKTIGAVLTGRGAF